MLLEFNFKNYKSFRNKTSIDLRATEITEHEKRVRYLGEDRVLTAAVIYGANASGKSNFYDAFHFFCSFILGETESPKTYFYSDELTSRYEVLFSIEEEVFRYGFELVGSEVKKEYLEREDLYSGESETVFKREGRRLDFRKITKRERELLTPALKKGFLILSVGASGIGVLSKVYDWFSDMRFIKQSSPNIYSLLKHSSYRENLIKLLKQVDQTVEDLRIDNSSLRILHRRGEVSVAVDLNEESSGLNALLTLFPALIEVIENGSLLVVDQLGNDFHPLLLRDLIFTFLNWETNPFDAQIIITTNDVSLLTNSFLRRDEIWFVEKEGAGNSKLYSLTDIVDEKGRGVKKEERYDINYLLGKYGSIPRVKRFELIE